MIFSSPLFTEEFLPYAYTQTRTCVWLHSSMLACARTLFSRVPTIIIKPTYCNTSSPSWLRWWAYRIKCEQSKTDWREPSTNNNLSMHRNLLWYTPWHVLIGSSVVDNNPSIENIRNWWNLKNTPLIWNSNYFLNSRCSENSKRIPKKRGATINEQLYNM